MVAGSILAQVLKNLWAPGCAAPASAAICTMVAHTLITVAVPSMCHKDSRCSKIVVPLVSAGLGIAATRAFGLAMTLKVMIITQLAYLVLYNVCLRILPQSDIEGGGAQGHKDRNSSDTRLKQNDTYAAMSALPDENVFEAVFEEDPNTPTPSSLGTSACARSPASQSQVSNTQDTRLAELQKKNSELEQELRKARLTIDSMSRDKASCQTSEQEKLKASYSDLTERHASLTREHRQLRDQYNQLQFEQETMSHAHATELLTLAEEHKALKKSRSSLQDRKRELERTLLERERALQAARLRIDQLELTHSKTALK